MEISKKQKVSNAIMLGTLCSVAYLAVYFARNILGVVTPQMIESGRYTEEYIGKASSVYFVFYAVGQLINGFIGDRVKAKYMISGGLLLAGITNLLFAHMGMYPGAALFVYGMTGFFLAMIYGPMTKVVAENMELIYATRCSLGYTFSSLFGSPLAGVVAMFFAWQAVFDISSLALGVMAIVCFGFFVVFERKGVVKYNQFKREKGTGGNIRLLIKHHIVRFTVIAIVTGVVRTSVVFWLPTYFSAYLGFSPKESALIFTITSLVISASSFVAIFVYECLGRDMYKTLFIMFSVSAASFLVTYFVNMSYVNIVFITLAVFAANGAATMLWSRYCPSLRETGMTSSATGFLDFCSYMAAAFSSAVFANAVTGIGWGNLILVWVALMVVGVASSVTFKSHVNKDDQ